MMGQRRLDMHHVSACPAVAGMPVHTRTRQAENITDMLIGEVKPCLIQCSVLRKAIPHRNAGIAAIDIMLTRNIKQQNSILYIP